MIEIARHWRWLRQDHLPTVLSMYPSRKSYQVLAGWVTLNRPWSNNKPNMALQGRDKIVVVVHKPQATSSKSRERAQEQG